MTTYRVKVNGKTVWKDETDGYVVRHFPGEYMARPAEDASHAPELYVDDVLIGVQRSHTQEAAVYDAAADTEEDPAAAAQYRAHAAVARAHAAARIAQEA